MSVRNHDAIRHAVILAHPGERSFNAAIADAYCDAVRDNGQVAVQRDLYRLGFDPVLKEAELPGRTGHEVPPDVQAELDALRGCHVFAFIYPIWFGMPPAMMKGYVDRVIGSGVSARQIRAREGEGLLSGAHLLCITTSGAPEAWLDEQGQRDGLRQVSGRYLFHAFAMKSATTMHIGSIEPGLSERTADLHLRTVREQARKLCAKLFAEHHGMTIPTVGDGS